MTRQDKITADRPLVGNLAGAVSPRAAPATLSEIGASPAEPQRALSGVPRVPFSSTGEASAPNLSTVTTADASKMSGRNFLDAIGLSSPEAREARREQSRQRCIRAIHRGDTFGFPPSLVAECRDLIAERETDLSAPAGWNRVEL